VPEGDTIHRAAAAMHRALAGAEVRGVESPLPHVTRAVLDRPAVGAAIDRVEARGKYLLVHLSSGLSLLTHMRMNGSWHLYRRGERWHRPRSAMRLLIVTDTWEAVGFDLPVVEVHDAASLARSDRLARLGPDPLGENFRTDEAVARLRTMDGTIEEALLDQRALAGIGNVLKAETLFVARVNPYTPLVAIGDEKLKEIVEAAARLLKENVLGAAEPAIARRPPARSTTRAAQPGAGLYVYGRAGRPCRRCGTTIRFRRAGRHARGSYWCPECQKIIV
jgi:endonuclease-8